MSWDGMRMIFMVSTKCTFFALVDCSYDETLLLNVMLFPSTLLRIPRLSDFMCPIYRCQISALSVAFTLTSASYAMSRFRSTFFCCVLTAAGVSYTVLPHRLSYLERRIVLVDDYCDNRFLWCLFWENICDPSPETMKPGLLTVGISNVSPT